MIKTNESIAVFLENTNLLLDQSLTDPYIKNSVALLGYDEVKLSEVKSLLLIFEELCDNQNNKYTNTYQEQDDFLKRCEVTNGEYLDLITISKIAFKKDLYALQALGLNNIRRKSFSGWLSQGIEFCSALISNTNYILTLEAFGQTINTILAVKKQIVEIKTHYDDSRQEVEEAGQTVQIRDEILDLLSEWINDYKKIVRIVLKDKPQFLEKLGLSDKLFQDI